MGAADLELAKWICDRARALMNDGLETHLGNPQIDAMLRTLIPGTEPLGGFPDNPDNVAYDFVMGWLIAEAEMEAGWAQPGLISAGARMALSILRASTDDDCFAPAMWTFIDLGYSTNRLGVTPEDGLAAVLAN